MDRLRVRWGYDACLAVSSIGRSGGLAMLWNSETQCTIKSYSQNHIDAEVKENGTVWRLTLFYGHPETSRRCETWNLLRRLKDLSVLPWLCVRDFNEILFDYEKRGGATRPLRQMELFREAVQDCGFQEINWEGPMFTWYKGKGIDMVEERLDRGLATRDWLDLFPCTKERHLISNSSDHSPLLFKSSAFDGMEKHKVKPFRFEYMWKRDEHCENVIAESWGAHVDKPVGECIRECGIALSKWNHVSFGHVGRHIKAKERELEMILKADHGGGFGGRSKKCRQELDELLRREEMLWKQRSKDLWVKEGNRNTKYFHAVASRRKRHNQVSCIQNSQGRNVTREEEIVDVFNQYFNEIFTSGQSVGVEKVMGAVSTRLDSAARTLLYKDFTTVEVKEALNQMSPLKAPGPDGMNAFFYQRYWKTVKPKVCGFVFYYLHGGEMPKDLNHTNIILISKVKTPRTAMDYRPISLCNVAYKLVAKVLANRLKRVLPDIICPNQGAFVPGRQIFDNSMVAYETIASMKNRRKGKVGAFALKLDMSKAYDRVEWDYLENVMRRLGFSEVWIGRVMGCVRTVTYSVVVNGQARCFITPSRGLKQGDPLSPYLFLLCVEGLSALLAQAEAKRSI
ncbi:hypothetical protein PTKIN_Ptkin12aG0082200 [Pterospermum kingtungense]